MRRRKRRKRRTGRKKKKKEERKTVEKKNKRSTGTLLSRLTDSTDTLTMAEDPYWYNRGRHN